MLLKRKTVLTFFIMLFAFAVPSIVNAQAPDPGGDPDVPIDGGLSLLVAAGVGYVAKKGYDKRKRQVSFKEGIER